MVLCIFERFSQHRGYYNNSQGSNKANIFSEALMD
jgi:hypothetical protein